MAAYYNAEPPKKDSVGIQEIEAYTNTKLNINWVPSTAYEDKVNTARFRCEETKGGVERGAVKDIVGINVPLFVSTVNSR